LRQFRRVYDLEVNVAINPNELSRHDAFNLGLTRTVQALAAVVYRDAPEREKLVRQLEIYLNSKDTGFDGPLLGYYQAPINGALKVIEEIKAAQPKK
jgi:hypothetical protein